MRIIWRESAEADMNELVDYLGGRDPRAARRISDAIRSRAMTLADQAGLGRLGRSAGTRELVVPRTPYIVAYTVDQVANAVIVLRVLHGARHWPDDLRPL
jgi:toxin ParE1/3/4